MVNAVGTACHSTGTANVANAVSSLDGRIRNDKIQLDDWATCVSAKTVKGQAEIQRLSSQISADRAQVLRVEALQSGAPDRTSALSAVNQSTRVYGPRARLPGVRGTSLDVWA